MLSSTQSCDLNKMIPSGKVGFSVISNLAQSKFIVWTVPIFWDSFLFFQPGYNFLSKHQLPSLKQSSLIKPDNPKKSIYLDQCVLTNGTRTAASTGNM